MVQETLKIAAIQLELVWEKAAANRAQIEKMFGQLAPDVDVVFLPEMFSTGFTMNVAGVAELMNGSTVEWLRYQADKHDIAICGSLIIQENNEYFNRLVFAEPSGNISYYDKRHLFRMGNENLHFKPGKQRLIVQYKGWRICPLICYDLRFPVWSRNRNEYDILAYLANWPGSRSVVWNTLLKARAIENQSYVVGVNCVGVDGNQIGYLGQSQFIDAKGHVLAQVNNFQGIISAEFSFGELTAFRTKFPVLDDADSFLLD
jgi:predicted amidohydrolase